MKKHLPFLFFIVNASIALSSFAGIRNSLKSVKAEENNIDYSSWSIAISGEETVNRDLASGRLLNFSINTGSKGLMYADTATSIDGNTNVGYLNDHRTVVSDSNGHYMVDYVYFNGRSFREIIVDNETGVTDYKCNLHWLFEIGGQYAPVTYQINGNYTYVSFMGDYLDDQGILMNGLTVEFKKGCPFRDASGNLYILQDTISANVPCKNSDSVERFAKVTDDKENLNYVRDTVNSSNSFGMRAMQVWFRYPFSGFAGNYILDHYMALSSFITINNKSVQEWNATMDDSSWDYSSMQLAGGSDPKGIYNRPIRMFVDGGNASAVTMSFHPKFLEQFTNGEAVTFGIKKGLSYLSNGQMKYQNESVNNLYTYSSTGTVFAPVKANSSYIYGNFDKEAISITEHSNSFTKLSDSNFYAVDFKLNKDITHVTAYDLFDGNDSKGLNNNALYNITINGKTINEINKTTNVTSYDNWTMFPTNVDDVYKKPVITSLIDSNTIRLIFNKKYIQTFTSSLNIKVSNKLVIYDTNSCTSEVDPFYCHNAYALDDECVVTIGNYLLTKVEAKESTCEEQGNVEYYYDEINDKYYKDESMSEEYTNREWLVEPAHTLVKHDEVAATCEVDGNIEYYECSRCHKCYTSETCETQVTTEEIVIKASHDLVKHDRVESTCSSPGLNEYYSCNKCHKYYLDNEAKQEIADFENWINNDGLIDKLDHEIKEEKTWTDWVYENDRWNISLVIRCNNCDHVENLPATVSVIIIHEVSEFNDGETRLHAVVNYEGVKYETYKTIYIPKTGKDEEEVTPNTGCKGSIVATSILLTMLSLTGLGLFINKKKEV